jgi:hypothetical protein
LEVYDGVIRVSREMGEVNRMISKAQDFINDIQNSRLESPSREESHEDGSSPGLIESLEVNGFNTDSKWNSKHRSKSNSKLLKPGTFVALKENIKRTVDPTREHLP